MAQPGLLCCGRRPFIYGPGREAVNDLEGQNYIAYSATRPNKSMHAEYQVDPFRG